MSTDEKIALHLDRAAQERETANLCASPAIQRIHLQLAIYHEDAAARERERLTGIPSTLPPAGQVQ